MEPTKIQPTKEGIKKLTEILLKNAAKSDIVWGPELEVKELKETKENTDGKD